MYERHIKRSNVRPSNGCVDRIEITDVGNEERGGKVDNIPFFKVMFNQPLNCRPSPDGVGSTGCGREIASY